MMRARALDHARRLIDEQRLHVPSWHGHGTGTCTASSDRYIVHPWHVNTTSWTTTSAITLTTDSTSATPAICAFTFWTNIDSRRLRREALRDRRQHELQTNQYGQTARTVHKDRMFADAAPEEIVALQLLRKMIDADNFRRYLKHGFIVASGLSGLSYQIKRGQERIVVRDQGTVVAELCVHLRDWRNKPPTDEVVAKLLIVECDEPDIWKRANVTMYKPELARGFKAA